MRKRVVQVVAYYPPHTGGMEIRAKERAEKLAAHGWEVTTLTSSQGTYPHVVHAENQHVHYLKSIELAHTPFIFSLPLSLARLPKGSVVQVETAVAFCPEITALACRLRGIPYIARVPLDAPSWSSIRGFLLGIYQKTILKWVYGHATAVIVLNQDDVGLIAQKYGVSRERLRVIPNAINHAAVNQPREKPHTPLRLLFVGRLATQKNVPLLLQAVRYYLDHYEARIDLQLVGDGEQRAALQKLIQELALEQFVTMRGTLSGAELEAAYKAADVFMMTSTHESLPAVLIEAMAKALPIIAGNIFGVRTIVRNGNNGLLTELSPKSIALALHRLQSDAGLYARLSRGSLKEMSHYTWQNVLAEYTDVYETALQLKDTKKA